MTKFVSPAALAKCWGYHETTIVRLIKSGQIPAVKLGRRYLVDPDLAERSLPPAATKEPGK